MKLVDSSGWLEYFTDGPLADDYAAHLEELSEVLTSVVVLYEVYRWIKRERSEEEALLAVAQIDKTEVVPVTPTLALTAADLGLEHGLAMADAMVYATALLNQANLVTSDADLAHLQGVVYLEK
ncbi:MAG: type II toxin-antitoxin system VapC family toxin [Thermoanaerobaculia bacterium]